MLQGDPSQSEVQIPEPRLEREPSDSEEKAAARAKLFSGRSKWNLRCCFSNFF